MYNDFGITLGMYWNPRFAGWVLYDGVHTGCISAVFIDSFLV